MTVPAFVAGTILTAAQLNVLTDAVNLLPIASTALTTGASFTGPLLISDGSAAGPGLGFVAPNATTGLWRAGTSVFVGIATANALEISSPSGGGYWAKISNGTSVFGPIISAEAGVAVAGLQYTTKGAAPHKFQTNAGADTQFQISNTTSAVNYFAATGGIAGASAKLSATGTDTDIDAEMYGKGLGKVRLVVNSGTVLQCEAQGIGGYYLRLLNNTGTGGPILIAEGATASSAITYITKGTSQHGFATNGSASNVQFEILHSSASTVNKIQVAGAATATRAGFRQRGESTVGMSFDINGSGDFLFTSAAFTATVAQLVAVASSVNAPKLQPGVTTKPVIFGVATNASDTDVGVAIVPKGTGPITAQVWDGASTAGNARGANAVDFQTLRDVNTKVASGLGAFIGAGQQNTASGQYASVVGGQNNTASANMSVVGGGDINLADGVYAWVPGGRRATTRGMTGRGSWSAGAIAATGDAQAFEAVLRQQTTDATQTAITADGSTSTSAANQLLTTNQSVQMTRLFIVARQSTTGDCAAWVVDIATKRGTTVASTALLGGGGASIAPTYNDAGAAAWRVSAQVDAVTRGAVNILVTGEAAKTINWCCRVMAVECIA